MRTIIEMEHSGVVHMLKNSRLEGTVSRCEPPCIIYVGVPTHTCQPQLFLDLLCMYKLFARVEGGHACIIDHMSTYLRETGRALVTEEPGNETSPGRNATSHVQNLLDLRDQYNLFLEKSFNNDQTFRQAIGVVSALRNRGYFGDRRRTSNIL